MKMIFYKGVTFALFLQIFLFSPPLARAAKLAIVIDDIGYRSKEDSAIYDLPKAVSVAIIPSAPNATERAKQAYEQQRDILIHLPMQPQNHLLVEAGALVVGMDEEKVQRIIRIARQRVPYAIGLNNHMGSRATTDSQLMQYLMQTLKTEQLFFLDSKTAGNSVAYKTAKNTGISALERHIFLDDSDELADVQRQFEAAIRYARKHGVAIMIGHPRKNSIKVLQQGITHLPEDIELTPISSLWRQETVQPAVPFKLIFALAPALTSISPFHHVPLLRGVPKD